MSAQNTHPIERPDPAAPRSLQSMRVAAHQQLAFERTQFDAIDDSGPQCRAWIWECDPTLVITPMERRLPGFARACENMAASFGPVCMRSSGGSAVALAPGVVCLTVIERWNGAGPTMDASYRHFCAPVQAALAVCGVSQTSLGSVRGAFCDGAHNILVAGRKIAGTSQRRRVTRDGGVLMSHAVVLVSADPDELSRQVGAFYAAAGAACDIRGEACISLHQCTTLQAGVSSADFLAALSAALSAAGTFVFTPD